MLIAAIYVIGISLAFYIAWCLGSNDAANPTNCAVGAGVISMKRAVILFAIFAGIGGILLGPFVMRTIDHGIVPRGKLDTETLALGSFAAILSACLWVTFSTRKGMPVSTTHSIVGGILGFGLILCPHLIQWGRVQMVLASFITSPFLALLLAVGLFFLLRRYFRKTRTTGSDLSLMFSFLFVLFFMASLSISKRVLGWNTIGAIAGGFLISSVLSAPLILAFQKKYGKSVERKILPYLLVLVFCLSAFAFGANDIANATGVFVTPTEKLLGRPPIETMLLLCMLGAVGIAIGGLTWGYRVITTAAYRVTALDPLTGVAAEYANAFTVLFFTTVPAILIGFGMPISTSLSNIGAVIGVGLASKGLGGVDRATVGKVAVFWILTIPCVALMSMGMFRLFGQMMGIL